MRRLELLAPAKNLECGIAAIDHGADAVYIGAQRFGARAAAGNSVADIAALCTYAHRFLAKVYVTLNTIVYDNEIDDLEPLVIELAKAGVDAFLLQDMGLLALCRKWLHDEGLCVALHASTQTHNHDLPKVKWLHDLGFERVVLSRESDLRSIAQIHEALPGVELEAFVHGALCVSLSGLCNASQHCFGRSANRGECAQFCRLKFGLQDADGHQVAPDAYWLSLKDMCRIDHLGDMAQAGVCSFKIEGRLKDVDYVKNVVAAYSQRLDQVVASAPDVYQRASLGRVQLAFAPDVARSFNRGFTTYFDMQENAEYASPATPKAIGPKVATVMTVRRDRLMVRTLQPLANGDGLCFFDTDNRLVGFRVNKVAPGCVFPLRMPAGIKVGTTLYRSFDQEFERLLAKPSASRRIPLDVRLSKYDAGLRLTATVAGTGISVTIDAPTETQQARTPQADALRTQLSRLGQTIFVADSVTVDPDVSACFVPTSRIAGLRRDMVDAMERQIAIEYQRQRPDADFGTPLVVPPLPHSDVQQRFPYLYNVANTHAKAFYRLQDKPVGQLAYELSGPARGALLMQCKLCVRHVLGYCTRRGGRKPLWKEPLCLVLPDGRKFDLEFRCDTCQMFVYAQK